MKHEPLQLVQPQFEMPLPALQPAVSVSWAPAAGSASLWTLVCTMHGTLMESQSMACKHIQTPHMVAFCMESEHGLS